VASEYQVVIPPRSERDLDQITPQAALREAVELIGALKYEPYPPYAWQLAEQDNMWAFDVWDRKYRVVYQVSEKQRKVIVKAAGGRADVYKGSGLYRKGQGLRL
jgi:mRNA-degrading endonuclease RelE of RelBE toxin-antitoxin system